jgi:hypothetical protein
MKAPNAQSEVSRMFHPDQIQSRIQQRPFVPLRIVTSSGESYDVRHPELVMVGRRELVIGTPSNRNPLQFDGINRVAIMHVTDLQDLPVPSA